VTAHFHSLSLNFLPFSSFYVYLLATNSPLCPLKKFFWEEHGYLYLLQIDFPPFFLIFYVGVTETLVLQRCKSQGNVSSAGESPKAHNKVGRPRKKKVEGEEGALAQPLVNGISSEVSPSPRNVYSPAHMVLYTPPLPSTLTSRVCLEAVTHEAATVLVDGNSPSEKIMSSQNVSLNSPTRSILSSMMSLKVRPDCLNQVGIKKTFALIGVVVI